MTKAPTPTEMSKGQKDNTKKTATKSSITQRFRTVSWSNYDHRTGVVNRFTGPAFPLPVIKRTHILKFVNKPPYIDNKPTGTQRGEVIKIDIRTA